MNIELTESEAVTIRTLLVNEQARNDVQVEDKDERLSLRALAAAESDRLGTILDKVRAAINEPR